MYLVVFATLVIAILGTYTQVLAVEAARIASGQTSAAQTMLAWHTAAVSMAGGVVNDASSYGATYASTGCSLSYDRPLISFSRCPAPAFAGLPTQTSGTVTNAETGTVYTTNMVYNHGNTATAPPIPAHAECVHLPNTVYPGSGSVCTTTFDVKDYEFYSVLFRDTTNNANIDYAITYAAPASNTGRSTNSTTATIQLASGTATSLSTTGLITQMKKLGISPYMYGTYSQSSNSISGASYIHLPSGMAYIIPDGAVVLYSNGL